MKRIIVLTGVITLLFSVLCPGQGCVAIRGGTSCSGNFGNSQNLHQGEFNTQLGFRHFKSFRHFRGDVEEINRVLEGTEVINRSNFIDVGINYGLSDRFFLSLLLPYVSHTRSSMYEHGGNPPNGLGDRHVTSSNGLADIRLGAGYWLFDPARHNFNYALGLGVKLPTGRFDYTDTFYNQGPNKDQEVDKVVDQSIQPGDGGIGIALEVQGYHPLSHSIGLSTNVYYLFNFQETNGVSTANGNSTFSCPDQFALRIGGFYNTRSGFSTFLGGRLEGVPANDVLGGSAGYRRPGYAYSVEPGVGFSKNKFSFFASCPLAVYRNRTQSYEDKARTTQTGVYRHGDAAFADYLVSLVFSYRFGKAGHQELGPTILPLNH